MSENDFTINEVMRSLDGIDKRLGSMESEFKDRFRDQSIELSKNYVRVDVYSEQRTSTGQRIGDIEHGCTENTSSIKELEKRYAEDRKDDAKNRETTRRWIVTTFCTPFALYLAGLAIKLYESSPK